MALKDMPQTFDLVSEEDILIAVVKYFQEHGFELDEMRTETRFIIQFGHNDLPIAMSTNPWKHGEILVP